MQHVLIFALGCVLTTAASYKATLDPFDKFRVSWTTTGTGANDYITFTVEAETTGWVGLGFSPNGGMRNADIIVGWVDSSGQGHITDRYAEFNSFPELDDSNDVELVSASEIDSKTIIAFKRKLGTCDKGRDRVITSDTVKLIYAYGSKDPDDNILSAGDRHLTTSRGSKSLYLLDPQPPSINLPNDLSTFSMTLNQYEIPGTRSTTYHCSFHQIPKLNDKHHILSLEAVVTPGNEALVHHIVLYSCWNVTEMHMRGTNKTQGVCFDGEMPEFEDSCRSIIFAWAVGGSKFYLPDNTGYPLGGRDPDSPEYFMMEIHYDNPEPMIEGRLDSSGIKVSYTGELRDNDVGTVQVGDLYSIFVPPTTDIFSITAYCHSDCTRQWIPEEGVNVFAYMLHAHLLGVGIKVEWYRGGNAVGILASDDSYDFNFQENRLFSSPKKLLPGDTLKITCTMSSTMTRRTRMTYGGIGTDSEMCYAFIMYYPKQKIANCESIGSYIAERENPVYSVLGNGDPPLYGDEPYVNFRAFFDKIKWNDSLVRDVQQALQTTHYFSRCKKTGKEEYQIANSRFSSEQFKSIAPAEEETTCNLTPSSTPNPSSAEIAQAHSTLLMFIQAMFTFLFY